MNPMTGTARSTGENSTAYSDLEALAEDFWAWRALHQPVSSDDIPRIERSPDWIPDWSKEAIERRRRDLSLFAERWRLMEVKSWPISQQVDYRLIGSALARVHWELDITRAQERNPGFYVDQTLGALHLSLLKPPSFDEVRSREILSRIASIPQTAAEAKANLAGKAVKPFALAAIDKLTDVSARLRKTAKELSPLLSGVSSADLYEATGNATLALESFRNWLEAGLPQMSHSTAIGREAYIYFLKNVALMPFTPDQLLAMGAQEWERSVACETYERARNEGLPELPLFPTQAVQIAREAQEEQKIRQFLRAKHILTIPDWVQHYRNLPMPSYLEPLAFMGVADDLTSATRLNENGISYVKPPAPDLDYFSLSIAKDPRPLIVHEGVPGHYFQLVLSWAHQNPIRRRYYDSGANEGIGFYAEELLLQFGLFDGSPRTREIMYSYMRLRALRVEVDVKLALGLFTIDEATDCLEKIVPIDRATARQEATFFASAPGQAITYQIGKLQIVKFLADARLKLGAEFDLKAFHDFVWLNGNIPIALQRWEYLELADEIKTIDLPPAEALTFGR